MEIEILFDECEAFGIDLKRLSAALGSRDNWGGMVHAFEYVTVLSIVEKRWRMYEEAEERRFDERH